MIQDIAPHEYHNEYKNKQPEERDCILFYEERKVLVKWEDGKIRFPSYPEAVQWHGTGAGYTYLFTIDHTGYFLSECICPKVAAAAGFVWEDIQVFRRVKPDHLRFAGVTGWQLYRWYGTHRFCGRCGSRMNPDGRERMMKCPKCGNMEFPKICPAVIIAVTDGNRILMSKYAGREFKKYALLAGFNEIGETIEETVKREVMEEVGLKVKNITYYKSQPWSFSDTLLLGFFCELDGDSRITLDENELALAEWFDREHMPVDEDGLSLTNEMMMVFKNQVTK